VNASGRTIVPSKATFVQTEQLHAEPDAASTRAWNFTAPQWQLPACVRAPFVSLAMVVLR
jgi:hypothetical protein